MMWEYFFLSVLAFVVVYALWWWVIVYVAVEAPSFTIPHKVWLDDERPAPSDDWVTCKTAWEAIQYLERFYVSEISLDHDLGPADAGTGYDVILFLERNAFRQKYVPKKITIHTANPVARVRMEQALNNIEEWRPHGPQSIGESFA